MNRTTSAAIYTCNPAAALDAAGQAQQANRQAQLGANYEQFLRKQAYPNQQLQTMAVAHIDLTGQCHPVDVVLELAGSDFEELAVADKRYPSIGLVERPPVKTAFSQSSLDICSSRFQLLGNAAGPQRSYRYVLAEKGNRQPKPVIEKAGRIVGRRLQKLRLRGNRSHGGLPPGSPKPGDSRLNTPETTPLSIPTNLATAPRDFLQQPAKTIEIPDWCDSLGTSAQGLTMGVILGEHTVVEFKIQDPGQLESATRFFEANGYVVLADVEKTAIEGFHRIVEDCLEGEFGLTEFLDPNFVPASLPLKVRQNLSKISTPRWLKESMVQAFQPFLKNILGPLVHVSKDFHVQVKSGKAPHVGRGGYGGTYYELQGPYLIHQDFTGANLPTSPSMITFWTALNTSPDWNLRLYPGSHQQGLICHRWLDLEDERLKPFGAPIDIPAVEGRIVVFNGLILHSTSNMGPLKRLSADIRFFPLCGFLQSKLEILGEFSMASLKHTLASTKEGALQIPLLESLAWLGEMPDVGAIPDKSSLNWISFLHHRLRNDLEGAFAALARFVNKEAAIDAPEIYTSKYGSYPFDKNSLMAAFRDLESRDSSLRLHDVMTS